MKLNDFKKCYIVIGKSGCYEDAYSWSAFVFMCEKMALKKMKSLNKKLKKIGLDERCKGITPRYLDDYFDLSKKFKNKYDPNFGCDSNTGTFYEVEESLFYNLGDKS